MPNLADFHNFNTRINECLLLFFFGFYLLSWHFSQSTPICLPKANKKKTIFHFFLVSSTSREWKKNQLKWSKNSARANIWLVWDTQDMRRLLRKNAEEIVRCKLIRSYLSLRVHLNFFSHTHLHCTDGHAWHSRFSSISFRRRKKRRDSIFVKKKKENDTNDETEEGNERTMQNCCKYLGPN